MLIRIGNKLYNDENILLIKKGSDLDKYGEIIEVGIIIHFKHDNEFSDDYIEFKYDKNEEIHRGDDRLKLNDVELDSIYYPIKNDQV